MSYIKLKLIGTLLFLASSVYPTYALSEVHIPPSKAPLSKEVVLLDEDPFPIEKAYDEPNEFNYWQQFFRMMLILGFILGSVLIIAWFLKGYLRKRVQQVNHQNRIKVLERRNLSQKSMLYLVEVAGKQMVISDSQSNGVQFLMNLEPSEEDSVPLPVEKTKDLASRFSFTQILQRKLTNKSAPPFFNSKNIKSDYEIHEEN
ncbi:MAG: hypothetical protein S4CHLAM7_13640 [Chlamydiae bacterium]|nr:hypothetical protein [Chlamydiota bacterium]